MKVSIHELEEIEDKLLEFAVIFSKYKDKTIYVRHKKRATYEIPGGRREAGETIEACAKRELREETGATHFSMEPLFVYGVEKDDNQDYGQVFVATVYELSDTLEHEIVEVIYLDEEPEEYTYPLIQPLLTKEFRKRGGFSSDC